MLSCSGVVLAVLLFQSSNAVEIERVEAVRCVALVRWEVVLYRLQANTVLSNAHNDNTTGLSLARLVDFVWECDAYFRDGACWRVGSVAHEILLLRVDDERFATFVGHGGNGKAVVRLALLIQRKLCICFALFPCAAHASKEKEGANENQAEQDEHQQGDDESGVGRAEAIVAFVARHQMLEIHHRVVWCGVCIDNRSL